MCFAVACSASTMGVDAMGKLHVIIFGVMFYPANPPHFSIGLLRISTVQYIPCAFTCSSTEVASYDVTQGWICHAFHASPSPPPPFSISYVPTAAFNFNLDAPSADATNPLLALAHLYGPKEMIAWSSKWSSCTF